MSKLFPSSFRLRFGPTITLGTEWKSVQNTQKELLEAIRGSRSLYETSWNGQFLFPLYGAAGTVGACCESILYDPAEDGAWRRGGDFGDLPVVLVEREAGGFTFSRYPGSELIVRIAGA